jgi:hypothetical protein
LRFYAIQVTPTGQDPNLSMINGIANSPSFGSPVSLANIPTGISIPGAQWSSIFNGVNDPGALDIDFDITVNAGVSTGSLVIKGITQNLISQSTVFTGQRVQLYAGFTEGLPLANDQVIHQGLICDGQIYPAFGNWTGTDLSLTFIITVGNFSGIGGPTNPKNIIHNMPQGSQLSSAIQNALSTAFPNSQFKIDISNALTLNAPDQGYHQGLQQYMNYVKQLSHSILGTPDTTGYQGVQSFPTGYGKYLITDFTGPGTSIAIQFEDLIGQPTWIDQFTIQVKTVLRADINAAMANGPVSITLPYQLLMTTQAAGAFSLSVAGLGSNISNTYEHGNVLLFNGTWIVNKIRHVGHYRQPSGESWVTIIEASSSSFAGGLNPAALPGIVQIGGQLGFTGEAGGTGSSTPT